ncbi:carbohydrate kinase [Deinococcus koreensis]|uniref:Carbohydrate kinase n=1 Tax=Deinococcus koreensis TaxID=2054903 RepID=A0A2K3UTS8_9DEIO|nr:carbohydrate kinase [Deinococcus koreensis]
MLLGVDVGTTRIKVGAFTPDGAVRSLRAAPTPVVRGGPARAHHDPEALWATVAGLLREVKADLSTDLGGMQGGQIACIGLCSFGESGVLVDRRGEADRPVLAWYDDRPQAALAALKVLNPPEWRRRTGLVPDHTYGLPKLLWAAGESPLAGLCWLPVSDFIALRLTGQRSVGLTQAARTLLLDLRARRWMDALAAALGLPDGLLPPLRLPGQPLGGVSAEAAALTGLPQGLPVWESAHDQPCAAAGIGATVPGLTVNACGTAETLLTALPLTEVEQALARPGVAVGPHALPGLAYAMVTLRASGSTLDWALRLGGGEPELQLEVAAQTPAEEGPLFFPHLRLLTDDPLAPTLPGGLFLGLRETHGPPQLLRAVLEGLCCELARLHDRLPAPGLLRAVGGPTRCALWMRLKAGALNVPVEVYEQPHAAVWGAAWLAWRHLNAAGGTEVAPIQPPPRASFTPQDADPWRMRRRRYDALLPALSRVLAAGGGVPA